MPSIYSVFFENDCVGNGLPVSHKVEKILKDENQVVAARDSADEVS